MDQLNQTPQLSSAEAMNPLVPAEPLPPPIPDDAQLELVKKLKSQYDAFKRQVAPLHEKIDKWHELYEARPRGEKKFPWPGAANYQVPLAMATIDSIHARLAKAVYDVDPLWLAQPRDKSGVQIGKKAEQYLDYWADQMALPERLDMLIHNMLIEGVGIMRIDWERRVRQIPRTEQMDPVTGLPAMQQGQPQVTEYDGPSAKPIPLKDYVHIPADAPTIEDAVYVGHRVFRTHQQLLDRERAGHYFNVEELLLKSTAGDDAKDRTANPSQLLSTSAYDSQYAETRQYEIVELYGPYDWGDGPVPTLFAFSPEHSILLRLEPYPYEYGRAPYLGFSVYPRSNFFWGRSMADMLTSQQEELTALHNMRADSIARRIAPPIMRRHGAKWDPAEQPWRPGMVIDVTDPAELNELALSDIPQGIFAHEQDILAFTERMTGMSDVFMGRMGSPYATATAVNRVTSEGLARMDINVSRFQSGMKRLAWVLWWLLYQYRPYIDYFLQGDTESAISKEEMRPTANGLMPFEFRPHGQLSDASKEARRQQLTFLFQVSSGPLSQFYPDGVQALLQELYDAYDIKGRDTMLGPPWNLIQQQLQMAFRQGVQQGMQQGAQAAQA